MPDDAAKEAPGAGLPGHLDRSGLEAATSAVLVTDARLEPPGPRIVFANRVFRELTGYPADEILGATPRILQGPATERAVLDRLRAQLEAGEGFFGRVWNYRRDGTPFVMEWSIAPVRDAAGGVSHYLAMQRDVTAESAHAEALRASRDLLERTEAVAAVGGWQVDPQTYAVQWTRTAQAIFEVAADFEATVDRIIAFYVEPHREAIRGAVERALANGEGWDLELEIITGAGRRKWVRVIGEPEQSGGQCVRLSGTVQDITERRLAQEREWAAERFLVEISEHVPGFFYQARCDRDGRVVDVPFVSAGVTRLCGLSPERIQGEPEVWSRRIHPADRQAIAEATWAGVERGSWRAEYRLALDPNGGNEADYVWVEDTAAREREENGLAVWHGFVKPIAERKALEEQLRSQAQYDPLTGLGNRSLMRTRLEQELAAAQRKSERVAVLYLDLDEFKPVNDDWGHPTGDELLRQVAQRLDQQCRPYDEVARVGGDEFVVVAGRVTRADEAGELADRILGAFEAPFEVAGQRFDVHVSIGIAMYPDNGGDMDTLLRDADAALYRVKNHGGAAYAFYRDDMAAAAPRRTTLQTTLREALDRAAFALAYQPIVDAASQAVTGFEALGRWRGADGHWQAAGALIDAAESAGTIADLVERTLASACAAAAQWTGPAAGAELVINVSPVQIDRSDFAERLERCLAEAGLPASRLVLELSLGATARPDRVSVDALRALRASGCQIGVDDFGAAGASLELVTEWPLDQIKVGPPFVRAIERTPARAAVVESVARIAQRLGVVMVAKSVEREAEAAKLRELGCDRLQGFFLGAPELAR